MATVHEREIPDPSPSPSPEPKPKHRARAGDASVAVHEHRAARAVCVAYEGCGLSQGGGQAGQVNHLDMYGGVV